MKAMTTQRAAAIGAVIFVVIVIPYFMNVGSWLDLSEKGQDWASFGDYMGGVAGPIFSFLSVLLIVGTIGQQRQQLDDAREESKKLDGIRYVSQAEKSIEHLLEKKIFINGGYEVELGDAVWGLCTTNQISDEPFRRLRTRLIRLTLIYCQAIGSQKDKHNENSVFFAHRHQANEIVGFIKKHDAGLTAEQKKALEYCESLLANA